MKQWNWHPTNIFIYTPRTLTRRNKLVAGHSVVRSISDQAHQTEFLVIFFEGTMGARLISLFFFKVVEEDIMYLLNFDC